MAAALLGSFAIFSCGDESKKEQEAIPMQNDTRMEGEQDAKNLDDGNQEASAEFKDEKIAATFQHYLHIKTALVNSNAAEARSGGKMMVEALEDSNAGKEAGDAAGIIAESEDINEQRTAFSKLSAGMENMLKDALSSGEIYKQFCPMAFEGKGDSWYSSSREIRNPYYGDKMLKCGRIEDTIK